ncbi:aldolase/citrate lyase family protein [uncultured Paracoccus sp.]|uniref:aldolase/citrate lyase family protein n=1 Tax=uncultured Paracoccus sp. TaxID=189685 RepID=UPI00261E15C3|nr:aldolase/citrate lyase family protein [uncultured Paracoccus sp.]
MDLPKNRFKAALKAGQRQIGVWCSIPDPNSIELLANCGYDWLLIDTEHTPIESTEAVALLRAAEPYPTTPIVRPGWNDMVDIKRLLDGGAQSLLIPYVQSADEARAAVAAVRYPPRGMRGVSGLSRASRFGAIKDYNIRAEEEICLLLQLETVEAIEHLDEICTIDGVDGVFIGPADLAASMGHLGNAGHPEVKAKIVETIQRLTAAGMPAGFLSADQEMARAAADAGALFVAVDLDTALLRRSAVARREEWR